MNDNRSLIRAFIEECLRIRDDQGGLTDSESLFLSGRLDSLGVTRLVIFLEENYGVDFGQQQFDVGEFDTVNDIVAFADECGPTVTSAS